MVARIDRPASQFTVAKEALITRTIMCACARGDADRILVTVSVEVFTIVFGRAGTNQISLTPVALIASTHVCASPRHVACGKSIATAVCVFAVVDGLALCLTVS